jgi:hypothetical protein
MMRLKGQPHRSPSCAVGHPDAAFNKSPDASMRVVVSTQVALKDALVWRLVAFDPAMTNGNSEVSSQNGL